MAYYPKSIRIGNAKVRINSKCLVIEENRCPTCGQERPSRYIGIVKKIIHYERTGFAEAGDLVVIHFDNGKSVRGDSENGFTDVYPLSKELSWPSSA